MKTRHKFLALLFLVELLGYFLRWRFNLDKSGGSRIFFYTGLLGLGIYAVICLMDWINGHNRRRSTQRGLEVLPPKGADEKQ